MSSFAGVLQSARNSINRNMEPFSEGLHKVVGGSTASGYESDSEASATEVGTFVPGTHATKLMGNNHALCLSMQSPRADVTSGPTVPPRQPVIRKRLQKLSELQLRPEQVLIRDKLGFFLGVVNLWYCRVHVWVLLYVSMRFLSRVLGWSTLLVAWHAV